MDRFPEADIGWQDYNSSLTQPLASMRVHDFGAVSDVDLYSSTGPSSNYDQSNYFSNVFDDSISDDFSMPDQEFTSETQMFTETPTIELERGNSLLNFASTNPVYPLLDCSHRPAHVSLSAQLLGKFSLANPTSISDSAPVVVCYRRNLFAVAGSVTLPRNLCHLAHQSGEHLQIAAAEVAISASESLEAKPVQLISIPVKSAQITPTGQVAGTAPSAVPLAEMSGFSVDSQYVTLPYEWKRLQFRTSTLNNGRRKELQQYFQVHIKLFAIMTTGERVMLCGTSSNHVVVRGRSPRSFQPRKEALSNTPASRSRSVTVKTEQSASFGSVDGESAFINWDSANNHRKPVSCYGTEGYLDLRHMDRLLSLPDYAPFQPRSSPDLSTWPLPSEQRYGDDYFGAFASQTPQGSSIDSFRQSPYLSCAAECNYASSSQYQYSPPLASEWMQPADSMYASSIGQRFDAPTTSPRVKATKMKSKRRHSGKGS